MYYMYTYVCLHNICSVQYDGKRVVSGAYDYLVRVWDPVEGNCLHVLHGHTNRVYSLQVSNCYNHNYIGHVHERRK